jgi:lysozyme family protein
MKYSDLFNKAVITVLKHEGGFVQDPDDPGGATNYGISLRYLLGTGDLTLGDFNHDGQIDIKDIQQMTIAQATDIYHSQWWVKYGYENLADSDLAGKVFDTAINMGGSQAHILLQRSIRACGIVVTEDGQLGPKCFGAIATLVAAGSADALLSSFRSEQAGFYRTLIAKKPIFEKYKTGWLARAYS